MSSPQPPPGTKGRHLGLPSDWLNTTVATQWQTGLPAGFESRVTWRRHGGLWVGIAGRRDLIHLKLYAAADDVGPSSRHFHDLIALQPSSQELDVASHWVATQDPSPAVADAVRKVIAHVHAARR